MVWVAKVHRVYTYFNKTSRLKSYFDKTGKDCGSVDSCFSCLISWCPSTRFLAVPSRSSSSCAHRQAVICFKKLSLWDVKQFLWSSRLSAFVPSFQVTNIIEIRTWRRKQENKKMLNLTWFYLLFYSSSDLIKRLILVVYF